MQLNLPPDLETLINKRLSSGAYSNAEDVLRHALEAHDYIRRDGDRRGWRPGPGTGHGPGPLMRHETKSRALLENAPDVPVSMENGNDLKRGRFWSIDNGVVGIPAQRPETK